MKTIIISFLLLTGLHLGNAQLVVQVSNNKNCELSSLEKTETANSTALEAEVAIKHSCAAEKQLKAYLSKHLDYSAVLVENAIEGEAKVEVYLSKKGEIVEVDVIESPHREVSRLLENTLTEIEKLSFKDQNYKGDTKVRLDISFSLQ